LILRPDLFRGLIVAVDKYGDDRIPELQSPAGDAMDALRWLGALGVPWENTVVHLASRSPHRDRLEEVASALGTRFTASPQPEAGAVRLTDARRDSVVTSVGDLLALPAGTADGLIVFLLGHGFLLPRRNQPTTRVFLTEDYSERLTRNIDVGALADILCYTLSFRHVTVVFDACSVQPFGDHERQTVTPGDLSELQWGSLNPATGVALCSSSGQLELAQESLTAGDGSVFLSAFLDATENIEDDSMEFEGDQPVIDLRRVMGRFVVPRVRKATNQAQNPELSELGAYNRPGANDEVQTVLPLYPLDRTIDKVRFLGERSAREAAGGGRNWVDTALDHRHRVARVRGLQLGADHFREAASLAAGLPEDEGARRVLIEALLVIESDLRSQAEALETERWQIPPDMSDELLSGLSELQRAAEHGDRARQSGDDRLSRLAGAGRSYRKGLRELRLVIEVAYTKAVWEALRNVVRRSEGLDADDAVRVLGQWVAVADAPHLSSKADEIASRIGTDDGSLGLLLLRQHGRMEHERWWIKEGVDQHATPIAGDLLEEVRTQVADALVSDAAPALQDAIRRLLDTYPAVSEALDRMVLEALSRRAGTWTRRATG
jgi:hypothetical protein